MSVGMRATITIEDGQKYYFVCKEWNTGSMVLGENHGSTAYVYYDITAELSADSYWIIQKNGNGYTIQNSSNGKYLFYKNERIDGVAKGIQLADNVTDDSGRWLFEETSDGHVRVCNAGQPGQCFNVRTDGTNLVGTYTINEDNNSLFNVYNDKGESITGKTGGGTGGSENFVEGGSGVTAGGEYWELTGLKQPVVYSTGHDAPVLYSIINLRSGQYASISRNALTQSETADTKFYFMQNGTGVTVYTSDGKYISTSFPTLYEGNHALTAYSGTSEGNTWDFSFYHDPDYPGYNIQKTDNLSDGSNSQSHYTSWNDYQLTGYSVIGLYDSADPGSTFVFTSSDERHAEYLVECGISIEGYEPKGMKAYVDSIRINNKGLIYDKGEDLYYYPLPETARNGQDFTGKLAVKAKRNDGSYKLKIDGIEAAADSSFTLSAVSCARDYQLSLVKDGTEEVCQSKLRFTFLPIVEINMPSCSGSYYTTGSIRVTDPGTVGHDSLFIAAYKYRGATAQHYPKKSYAIKLRDENGNSVDREFFGLRDDNNWILDAMAIDKACMRNRVATDLWNDFATKPYHRRAGWEKKARTGTRGRFVEVFLNGQYHGLYCMTEKMDRKQLKLKKYVPATETTADTIHATLYKSTDWTYETFMGHQMGVADFPGYAPSSFNNNLRTETWQGYEFKYPDWETERIDWGPLWGGIYFAATSTDDFFDNYYEKHFDAPVIDDYYLFLDLLMATDNHGKNMFFFNYDQLGKTNAEMLGIAPWDLDGTWGRRWDGNNYLMDPNQDFTTFLWENEHGTHTLFHRLANSKTRKWNETLATRYAELRSLYFDTESLKKRFTDYAELFAESNADLREQNLWYSLHRDIQGDVEYICEWVQDRIDYLDSQYSYDPSLNGISPVEGAEVLGVAGGKGVIAIHSNKPMNIKVYDISGAMVRNVQMQGTFTEVNGLTPGVYIVGSKKVLVR